MTTRQGGWPNLAGSLHTLSTNYPFAMMMDSRMIKLQGHCAHHLSPSILRRRLAPLTPSSASSSSTNSSAKPPLQEVEDTSYAFVSKHQSVFRPLPLYFGGLGITGVLINRALGGIAPVVDAGSSQSRVDVLVIFMSAVLILTGLQWLSLKARTPRQEALVGEEIEPWLDPEVKLPAGAAEELKWAWTSLRSCTRCKSLVLLWQNSNIFHAGFIRKGKKPGGARMGDLCSAAITSGQGNYLANLELYPGRVEFEGFLPEGTQGVVIQPVGKFGCLIVGTDTVRGISQLDQSWIATIADKIEVSLEKLVISRGQGFKQ